MGPGAGEYYCEVVVVVVVVEGSHHQEWGEGYDWSVECAIKINKIICPEHFIG